MSDTSLVVPSPVDLTSSDRIRVVIRCRPQKENESVTQSLLFESSTCITAQGPSNRSRQYTFDHVANETASQDDIFEQAGRPVVECVTAGFHGTLFAYGQTGTGKTWTTTGPLNEANVTDKSKRGIIPRACEAIFQHKKKNLEEGVATRVRASYLEIYNEKIRDLLADSKGPVKESAVASPRSARGMVLRERASGEVFVEGGRIWVDMDSESDWRAILRKGMQNRAVASTAMNAESSRSHAIFTIEVTQLSDKTKKQRISQLHLVDLAGSERQKATGATGERLRESNEINKSLTLLGNVIQALVECSQGSLKRHIPYRDSKLTFLLKDALGGNSKTCFVATISKAAPSLSETISTLEFAKRCSAVKTLATINENLTSDVKELQDEVQRLRKMLKDAERLSDMTQTPSQARTTTRPTQLLDVLTIAPPSFHVSLEGCEGVEEQPTEKGPSDEHQRAERLQLVASDALSREDAARSALREAQSKRVDMDDLVGRQERTIGALKGVLELRDAELKEIRSGEWTRDSGIRRLRREIELTKVQRDNHPEIARLLLELSKSKAVEHSGMMEAKTRRTEAQARGYEEQLEVLTRELESALVENGVLRELATPRGGDKKMPFLSGQGSGSYDEIFSEDADASNGEQGPAARVLSRSSTAPPKTLGSKRAALGALLSVVSLNTHVDVKPAPCGKFEVTHVPANVERRGGEMRANKLNALLSTLRASVSNLEESILTSTRSSKRVTIPHPMAAADES